MVTVSKDQCNERHAWLKWLLSGLLLVALGGVGWAITVEMDTAKFHGAQGQFNLNTTETLKRIDKNVEAIRRHNGGEE